MQGEVETLGKGHTFNVDIFIISVMISYAFREAIKPQSTSVSDAQASLNTTVKLALAN